MSGRLRLAKRLRPIRVPLVVRVVPFRSNAVLKLNPKLANLPEGLQVLPYGGLHRVWMRIAGTGMVKPIVEDWEGE